MSVSLESICDKIANNNDLLKKFFSLYEIYYDPNPYDMDIYQAYGEFSRRPQKLKERRKINIEKRGLVKGPKIVIGGNSVPIKHILCSFSMYAEKRGVDAIPRNPSRSCGGVVSYLKGTPDGRRFLDEIIAYRYSTKEEIDRLKKEGKPQSCSDKKP